VPWASRPFNQPGLFLGFGGLEAFRERENYRAALRQALDRRSRQGLLQDFSPAVRRQGAVKQNGTFTRALLAGRNAARGPG
jgi:hypothetical protein